MENGIPPPFKANPLSFHFFTPSLAITTSMMGVDYKYNVTHKTKPVFGFINLGPD